MPCPESSRTGEVVIRVTLTTICGTDLHILKGEYPVKPGLIIGHEPVGVIHELGRRRDRIWGWRARFGRRHHSLRAVQLLLERTLVPMWRALGGWRFGNTIDGAQAEYLLIPFAQAEPR